MLVHWILQMILKFYKQETLSVKILNFVYSESQQKAEIVTLTYDQLNWMYVQLSGKKLHIWCSVVYLISNHWELGNEQK